MSLIANSRHAFLEAKEEEPDQNEDQKGEKEDNVKQAKEPAQPTTHYESLRSSSCIPTLFPAVMAIVGTLFTLWSLRLYHTMFPAIPSL